MPVDRIPVPGYVASTGGSVDYINELRRLRQGDGFVFRKTEAEVRAAIDQRDAEVQASMTRRVALIEELAQHYGIGNIGLVFQRVGELIDPCDVDPISYEPAFAVVLSHALAYRIEGDWMKTLRFMAESVTGDMELSFNALDMIFAPYSPTPIEREVSLRRAERNLRKLTSGDEDVVTLRARKRRRVDDDERFDVDHFLASEF